MNINTQRHIDAWVGPVLCALVSLWDKCFGRPLNRAEPIQKVLVIMLSEMGSMVLAGPMFAHIQKNHPGAQIHILQLKRNQSVARLLGLAPETHLHGIDDSGLFSMLAGLVRVLWRLRGLKLDAVIDLGPEGGDGGGRVVAADTPEALVKLGTHTGRALQPVLARQ